MAAGALALSGEQTAKLYSETGSRAMATIFSRLRVVELFVVRQWRFARDWTLTAKFDGEFGEGSQTYAGTGRLAYSW